ncbi:MAG: SLBB domain-containing protein [Spirochaetaceae bacterium]
MKKFIGIVLFVFMFVSLSLVYSVDVEQVIVNQYPDYPATPGDVYEIAFSRAGSVAMTMMNGFVDNDYIIDLSFLGTVNVRGLTYVEIQDVLRTKFTKAYPGSLVNVSIKVPGKFKVTLIGEVKSSEIIEVNSLTTLALVSVGKTTAYADYRAVEVSSEDGTVKSYDLFKYSRFADLRNNPFLRPNDVITYRPYNKMVTISGQVKRPGVYQLLDTDTLDTVINLYSDGFTKLAETSNISIKRTLEADGSYQDTTLYIDAVKQNLSIIKLSDYDVINIENRVQYNPKVVVQGAITTTEGGATVGSTVSNKLPVVITSGSKVSTVISQMDGSFNLTSDLENAFILRGTERILVDISDVLNNPASEYNVEVKDKDMIVIPFRQLHVYVAGSVNSAKAVPFIEDRTANYYIGIAGGVNKTENLFGSYSVKDMYGNKLKDDVIISPEDLIWVSRNHPMSYITEYGGWLITVAAILTAAQSVDTIIEALQ